MVGCVVGCVVEPFVGRLVVGSLGQHDVSLVLILSIGACLPPVVSVACSVHQDLLAACPHPSLPAAHTNPRLKEKVGELPASVKYFSAVDTPDVWLAYPWECDGEIEEHDAMRSQNSSG